MLVYTNVTQAPKQDKIGILTPLLTKHDASLLEWVHITLSDGSFLPQVPWLHFDSHLSREDVGCLRVIDVGVGRSADVVPTVCHIHLLYHQSGGRER